MKFLDHHGISFIARDVVLDAAARSELLSLGSKTLPTTIIDGQTVIGFDRVRLRELLGI
jgi:glutaredoxin